MRDHILIILGLFGLVSSSVALSLPDDATPLNLALVNEALIDERSVTPCAVLPNGSAPIPSPDTADAFTRLGFYSSTANHAKTSKGYTKAFSSMSASVSLSPSVYLGFTLLETYDLNRCASICDSTKRCIAFNTFFERSPSLRPGPSCPNPPSVVYIKCALWAASFAKSNATNSGQYRDEFKVVIAGSNGYVRGPSTMPTSSTRPTLATSSKVSTSVTRSPSPSASTSSSTFKVAIAAPGQPYDGASLAGTDDIGYDLGPSSDYHFSDLSILLWKYESTTGYIRSAGNPKVYLGHTDDGFLVTSGVGRESDFPFLKCSIAPQTLVLSCGAAFYVAFRIDMDSGVTMVYFGRPDPEIARDIVAVDLKIAE
jgi:hypothetical protein